MAPRGGAASDEPSSIARLRREYEAYKASSIYPDWSYPLTADMGFLLAWNAPVTADLPLDEQQQIWVRFDADKGRVFPGEPYLSWLDAWRVVDGVKQPVPVQFDKAVVMITGGPSPGEAFELSYHDDGKDGDVQAGDFRYTSRFVPSERDELSRASQARIEAYVTIDSQTHIFLRDFVFSPRPVLEVVGIRDRIDNGSLVATLEVEVFEAGVYTFYGNLFAPDGAPLGMTKRSYPLEAGRSTADLVFFGKVLHDQQVDGPYTIRDIHGLKRQADDELNVWWSHPAPHQTGAYRASDFSDAEWSDPERLERLANFEQAIKASEAAGAAPP